MRFIVTFRLVSSVLAATMVLAAQATGDRAVPLISQISAKNEGADTLQGEDEIIVRSLEVKEVADKTFHLDRNGEVNFPLVGRLNLRGKTVPEVEDMLVSKLKTYYVDPDIELTVTTARIEKVSVIGSVAAPGLHVMKGPTTLADALSLAGGVKADAGSIVVVTREPGAGPIPNPNARTTAAGSVVEINLKSLLEARDPTENFVVMPHDLISVPAAQIVYVMGTVKAPGGFPLGGKNNLTVLQAVTLAGGWDPRIASPQSARIIRHGAVDQQIPVDLRKILSGKAEDVIMHPNDMLYVPSSAIKVVGTRAIEVGITIATGMLVFGAH